MLEIPRLLAALLSIFVVVATALLVTEHEHDFSKSKMYRGYFYSGLEVSQFHPCDFEEAWWIESPPIEIVHKYKDLTASHDQNWIDPKPIYLELIGKISSTGQYGHFGMSDRLLTIQKTEKIDTVNKTEDEQCEPKALLENGISVDIPNQR